MSSRIAIGSDCQVIALIGRGSDWLKLGLKLELCCLTSDQQVVEIISSEVPKSTVWSLNSF